MDNYVLDQYAAYVPNINYQLQPELEGVGEASNKSRCIKGSYSIKYRKPVLCERDKHRSQNGELWE